MTPTQQIAAVEIAVRIIKGGAKAPRVGTAEARMLAEQLASAADALRGMRETEQLAAEKKGGRHGR